MTGKQEGPYKGEETKAEGDKLWQLLIHCILLQINAALVSIRDFQKHVNILPTQTFE